MFYDILEQSKNFGDLNKVDRKLKNIIEDDQLYYNLIRANSNEKDIQLQKKISREKEGAAKLKNFDEENNVNKNVETQISKIESYRNSIKKQYDFGENNIFLKNENCDEKSVSSVTYSSSSSESEFDNDIHNYNIDPDIIKEYYSFLFTNVKKKRTYSVNTSKTPSILDRIVKKENSSLENINI